MKECTACKISKALPEFSKDARGRLGVVSRCHACIREHSRQYRKANPLRAREYYQENKEHIIAKSAEYYAANKEGQLVKAAAYKKLNAVAIKIKNREYYERNLDSIRRAQGQLRLKPENRDRYNAYSQKYRANPANKPGLALRSLKAETARKNAPGVCTSAQLQARIEYYSSKCWLCAAPYNSIDHVIPIAKGGSNWPANFRPACRSCNSRKGSTWPYNKEIHLEAYSGCNE